MMCVFTGVCFMKIALFLVSAILSLALTADDAASGRSDNGGRGGERGGMRRGGRGGERGGMRRGQFLEQLKETQARFNSAIEHAQKETDQLKHRIGKAISTSKEKIISQINK